MTKILILEEDEFLRLLYKTQLSDWGYDVYTARNGEEALELFDNASPDIVVMELRLSGMNGFKVMRAMLQLNSHVPLIINSSSPNYFKSNFVRWAAQDYIIKSSDLTELRQSIKRIARNRIQMTKPKKYRFPEKSNGQFHHTDR